MIRPIAIATLIAGTLDILYAMMLATLFGRDVGTMLRGVASGPFPGASGMGAAGALLGLLVHFALMAIMAAVFVIAARQRPQLADKPIRWGILYGLATYFVMNWIVLPLRFGSPIPPQPRAIATQLFAHVVLVGIPIALVAARQLRARPA